LCQRIPDPTFHVSTPLVADCPESFSKCVGETYEEQRQGMEARVGVYLRRDTWRQAARRTVTPTQASWQPLATARGCRLPFSFVLPDQTSQCVAMPSPARQGPEMCLSSLSVLAPAGELWKFPLQETARSCHASTICRTRPPLGSLGHNK
jgi:hypothetical protein